MAKDERYYVGCDDGFAQIKLAWFGPGMDAPKTMSFPSRARIGSAIKSMSGAPSAKTYETEGLTFVVQPPGEFQDTRFDGYPTSPLNRVLVHHGLRSIGLSGKEVSLTTGLPFDSYFATQPINAPLIAAKKKSLMKVVSGVDNVPTAVIAKQEVCPEAVAAVIDHMLGDDGQVVEEIEDMWTVIDIGGRTTDIVTVAEADGEMVVDHSMSGTIDLGVLTAMDLVSSFAGAEHSVDPRDIGGLDDVLSSRHIRMHGKRHDVSDFVAQAMLEVSSQILTYVQRKIRSGARSKVICVGGGAHIFKDVLSKNSHWHFAPEPEFANARGMLKQARFMDG